MLDTTKDPLYLLSFFIFKHQFTTVGFEIITSSSTFNSSVWNKDRSTSTRFTSDLTIKLSSVSPGVGTHFKKTYIEFKVAAWFLDGQASFFESEVTSVIVIQNGDTSSLIFTNFEFRSNTTTGLEGTRVIENTKLFTSIPVKGLIRAFITGIYGVYRYILPEVGDGDKEVFIFFKDFVINNWDLDLLSGIAILENWIKYYKY